MRRFWLLLIFVAIITCVGYGSVMSQKLTISSNGRYLQTVDGEPFFWLGDTAWGLFHRTNKKTATVYLEKRAKQGFTIIQACILAAGYWDGLGPNLFGEAPFLDDDPTRPNEAFFAHVDWVIEKAEDLGLFIGLLPTWGEYVCPAWHDGPKLFDSSNAEIYGTWMGARYRDQPNIMWILGGDREADQCGSGDIDIWRSMARGIRAADQTHLITFHPNGYSSSSEWFHTDTLFDFNMIETYRFVDTYYRRIFADYRREPPKPIVQGEPAYEDEVSYSLSQRVLRSQPYWSFLAGAKGHTYGKTYIAYYVDEAHPHDWSVWSDLNDHLESAGAGWLMLFGNIFRSLPWWELVPNNAIITGYPGRSAGYIAAAHTERKSHILVYFPINEHREIDMSILGEGWAEARWINTKDGSEINVSKLETAKPFVFKLPIAWEDGLLVIEKLD